MGPFVFKRIQSALMNILMMDPVVTQNPFLAAKGLHQLGFLIAFRGRLYSARA